MWLEYIKGIIWCFLKWGLYKVLSIVSTSGTGDFSYGYVHCCGWVALRKDESIKKYVCIKIVNGTLYFYRKLQCFRPTTSWSEACGWQTKQVTSSVTFKLVWFFALFEFVRTTEQQYKFYEVHTHSIWAVCWSLFKMFLFNLYSTILRVKMSFASVYWPKQAVVRYFITNKPNANHNVNTWFFFYYLFFFKMAPVC